MQKIIFVFIYMLAFKLVASDDRWQIIVPFSFASILNDVKKSSLDFAFGIQAKRPLVLKENLFLAFGLGLFATIPSSAGNNSVAIKRQSSFAEAAIIFGNRFTRKKIAISPTLGLKTALGAIWYKRQALRSTSGDSDLLFWLGPTAGIAYWIDNWTLGINYDLCFGTTKLRQALEISLGLRI